MNHSSTGGVQTLLSCEGVQRHLDAYLDGEVDPRTQIEFDSHLAGCARCREQELFGRAVKRRVRETVHETRAPAGLLARVQVGLDEADADAARRTSAWSWALAIPAPIRFGVPLSAAAGCLLVFAYAVSSSSLRTGAGPEASAAAMPVFEDVVRVHSSDLPVDVRGEKPDEVQSYFRNRVRFPVRPAAFQPRDARFVGARLSNVRERSAAVLYYDVGGHRLTVVVFDGAGLDTTSAQSAQTQGREVFYHQVNGYTVPTRSQGQITYAFAGDLDRQTLLRLAATARVDQ